MPSYFREPKLVEKDEPIKCFSCGAGLKLSPVNVYKADFSCSACGYIIHLTCREAMPIVAKMLGIVKC